MARRSVSLSGKSERYLASVDQRGIIPRFIECLSKLGLTHLPTLGIGLAAFAILVLSPLLIPRLPAALAAMVVTGSAVKLLGLDAMGVKVIGAVPGGLPALRDSTFSLVSCFPTFVQVRPVSR